MDIKKEWKNLGLDSVVKNIELVEWSWEKKREKKGKLG